MIVVVSPAQFERGKSYLIQWTAPTVSAKAKMKVELLDSHGGAWLISEKAKNGKGELKWTVGKWNAKAGPVYPNAADYRLRISTLDGGSIGQSQDPFAIASVISLNVTGAATLIGGQTAQYACAGVYDFGPARDVTAEVKWGFATVAVGGKAPGKMGKTGLLTTAPVLADQPCTITAAYGKGKPPVTGTLDVTITP